MCGVLAFWQDLGIFSDVAFTGCRSLEPVYVKPFVQVVVVFGRERTWSVIGIWFLFFSFTI